MGYSLDPISEGCYPGTTVLVNKFGIRNEAKLDEVETVLISTRNTQWLQRLTSNTFDFSHYCVIHHFLFSDLYDWAGQFRTVNISKKGTFFCAAESIDQQASLIFKRLADCNFFRSLPHDDFVEEVVDFYCVTNMLHPFREGNGRTQRAFLTQLIRAAGYDINWSEVDTDLLMFATIQSANGVTDLLKLSLHSPLSRIGAMFV